MAYISLTDQITDYFKRFVEFGCEVLLKDNIEGLVNLEHLIREEYDKIKENNDYLLVATTQLVSPYTELFKKNGNKLSVSDADAFIISLESRGLLDEEAHNTIDLFFTSVHEDDLHKLVRYIELLCKLMYQYGESVRQTFAAMGISIPDAQTQTPSE